MATGKGQRTIRWLVVKFALFYLGVVLAFATTYWIAWNFNADSFLVNEEFNLFPLYALRELGQGMPLAGPVPSASNKLNELSQDVIQIMKSYDTINAQLTEITMQLGEQTRKREEYWKQDERITSVNTERYKQQELAPLETRRAELERERVELMAKLETARDSKHIEELSGKIQKVIDDIKVANSLFFKKQGEVLDQIIHNYSKFFDYHIHKKFSSAYDEVNRLEQLKYQKEEEYRKNRARAYQLWVEKRRERSSRLGFVDFLYFSLGASTTTTFGDIVPNSRSIRLLVILQLLIGVILVGYFSEIVIETVTGGNSPVPDPPVPSPS